MAAASNRSFPQVSRASPQWIDDPVRMSIEYVCDDRLLLIIGALGIISNILNIVVFVKQGLNDLMNLKFTYLAVVDLCLTVCALMFAVLNNVNLVSESGPVMNRAFLHYSFCWPIIPISRASGCITVFITIERCVCITMPLKVKLIFTRRLVTVVMWTIFGVFVLILLPVYIGLKVQWTQIGNRTVLHAHLSPGMSFFNSISRNASTAVQFASYAAMLVFTAVLIVALRRQSARRQTMRAAAPGSDLSANDSSQTGQGSAPVKHSTRDDRVVRVVVLIAAVFIVATVPQLCMNVLNVSTPEVSLMGEQSNTFLTGWALTRLASTINSSVNIFIYVSMSSAFRDTLLGLARFDKK